MRLQAPPRSPSLASSLPMAREQEFDTDTCGVTLEDSNHLRDDLRWPHRSRWVDRKDSIRKRMVLPHETRGALETAGFEDTSLNGGTV
jgi:hypothetical protein